MSVSDDYTQTHVQSKKVWEQLNLIMEVVNGSKNYATVNAIRDAGRLKCLSEAPMHKGEPAIVTGSGSSVNGFMPFIKEWKGAIFCSTTHVSTYVKYGRPPDYFIAVDPREATEDEFAVPPDSFDTSAYVTHLSAPLSYFNKWNERSKGMCYVYRILEPSFDWYSRYLPAIYPWSKVALLPFIDSVATQIQLAARLGYDPIFMVGCDYGGPRLTHYGWKDGEWVKSPLSGGLAKGLVGPGGLDTTDQILYSGRGVLIASAMQILNEERKSRIYQTSFPSNLVDLPYVSQEQMLANPQQDEWPPAYRKHFIHQIEVRLAESNTYLIPANGGYGTDYRIFMMIPPNFLKGLQDMNTEILMNKHNFRALEKRFLSVKYDGKLLAMLDLQNSGNAVQNWLESPNGKEAAALAKAEGKKIELAPIPIREQIKAGLIQPQKGEMIIHEAAELEQWDWKKMAPIDIEDELEHLLKIKEESENIPPRPPFLPVPVKTEADFTYHTDTMRDNTPTVAGVTYPPVNEPPSPS